MPATVILIEASPRVVASGAVSIMRMAGGGASVPYHYSSQDWRAGVVQLPTFTTELGFDGGEIGTGGVPQAAEIQWAPSSKADLAAMAALYWPDAAVTIRIGPEGTLPPVRLTGKVLDAQVDGGVLKLQMADPAAALKKPLLTARYAGTGGLEGPVEWSGKIRRRVWGRVWNLAGEPIDKANNIYAFADPLQKLQAFDTLRDKGVVAASTTFLAWAGSAAATFAALQAATPPSGGAVLCPSIACVKWWTAPAGDLTADLRGEIGASYVETAPEIAERLVGVLGGVAFAAGTVAAAKTLRPAAVGWVAKDENALVAAQIEQLLGDNSLLWLLDSAGAIVLRPWAWGASTASAVSRKVTRKSALKPLATRKIGYQRNETQMARGDLAAIVLWADVGGTGRPEDGATQNVDGANMIFDPLGYNGATLTNGAIFQTLNAAGRPAERKAIELAFAANSTVRWSRPMACVPGEKLFYQHTVKSNGGGSETCNASMSYFDASGGALGAINLGGAPYNTSRTLAAVNGVWTTVSCSVTVPAGAAFVQFYVERPAFTGFSFYVGEPIVTRAQAGADVTATNTSANTSAVGTVPASSVQSTINTGGGVATNQVVTGAMVANAATVPNSAFNSAAISCPDGTETTVGSLTISTTGAPVNIIFSAQPRTTTGVGTYADLRFYRGTTLIWTSRIFINSSGGFQPVNTGVLSDTPSAGTYTYQIRVQPTGTGGGVETVNRSIIALETKR